MVKNFTYAWNLDFQKLAVTIEFADEFFEFILLLIFQNNEKRSIGLPLFDQLRLK